MSLCLNPAQGRRAPHAALAVTWIHFAGARGVISDANLDAVEENNNFEPNAAGFVCVCACASCMCLW